MSAVDNPALEPTIIFAMMQTHPAWEVRNQNNWVILAILGRIDSFNFQIFKDQLEDLKKVGHRQVAIDLSQAKFLSLPTIKLLADLATDLQQNEGKFALMAASEKLKRQIDIYASLTPMRVVRNSAELR